MTTLHLAPANAGSTGRTRVRDYRAQVQAAAPALDWTDTPSRVLRIASPAVLHLVAAIFHGRREQLSHAAATPLIIDGQPCLLVGLADAANRYYLLAHHQHADYVLHQPQPDHSETRERSPR